MKKIVTIILIALLVIACNQTLRALTYHWTAPSDNIKVTRYVAHYSLSADSTANLWGICRAISNMPTPSNPGQQDSVTLNVAPGNKYYMCIKAYDAAGNESWCSNIDSTYVPDTEPPTSITDLRAVVK